MILSHGPAADAWEDFGAHPGCLPGRVCYKGHDGHRQMGKRAFWGHCELCGRWRPVIPEQVASEAFFTHWRAVFTCCGREQVALITVEKDELDFH